MTPSLTEEAVATAKQQAMECLALLVMDKSKYAQETADAVNKLFGMLEQCLPEVSMLRLAISDQQAKFRLEKGRLEAFFNLQSGGNTTLHTVFQVVTQLIADLDTASAIRAYYRQKFLQYRQARANEKLPDLSDEDLPEHDYSMEKVNAELLGLVTKGLSKADDEIRNQATEKLRARAIVYAILSPLSAWLLPAEMLKEGKGIHDVPWGEMPEIISRAKQIIYSLKGHMEDTNTPIAFRRIGNIGTVYGIYASSSIHAFDSAMIRLEEAGRKITSLQAELDQLRLEMSERDTDVANMGVEARST